jgi:hypothetical protein
MNRVQPPPVKIRLTNPQHAFVAAPEPFPCICAGFGAGKTAAAIARALHLKSQYPKQNVAYYLPTYDLVRKIGYPRFAEKFEELGIRYKIRKDDQLIELPGAGQIIFRTMDTPERIVGYEVADSLVDELDTLKTDHAREAWTKIVSRNRQKKPDQSLNTVGVATTPEGFRFVYDRWKKNAGPGYRLIKASTYSNERNLPAGYIQSLKDTYSPQLLAAYLEGEFVNLTAGSVYAEFDRRLNGTTATIQPGETLHIGMDFNVTNMAAVVHVIREGEPYAVGELVKIMDTPAMAAAIKAKWGDHGHPIMVYPDASGSARKSQNASTSDLAILRGAGFSVCVNPTNPAVKDRVLSTNAVINRSGVRRYKVNEDHCPHYVEALEKQCYDKNGDPDKSTGLDHIIDAGTYFIAYKYPVLKPVTRIDLGMAH